MKKYDQAHEGSSILVFIVIKNGVHEKTTAVLLIKNELKYQRLIMRVVVLSILGLGFSHQTDHKVDPNCP